MCIFYINFVAKKIIEKFYRVIFYYVWRQKKVGHVNRARCIQPRDEGGINILNIQHQVTAMQAQWVRRFLDPSERA